MGTINFNGNITNSQIQNDVQNSSQTMTVSDTYDRKDKLIKWLDETLKPNLNQLNLNEAQLNQIQASIEFIKSNTKTSKIKEGLSTIRNVVEGITGSIIASGIIHQLHLFS